MTQYMIEMDLPRVMSNEFMALIPEQRMRINHLMSENVISGCSLSSDRTKMWITMNAKDEFEVNEKMKSFPLTKFMTYDIHELTFHFSPAYMFPQLSMN